MASYTQVALHMSRGAPVRALSYEVCSCCMYWANQDKSPPLEVGQHQPCQQHNLELLVQGHPATPQAHVLSVQDGEKQMHPN